MRVWLGLMVAGFSFTAVAGPAAMKTKQTVVGAIRWDAWHGDQGGPGKAVQQALSPAKWHYQLPFFAKTISPNQVVTDGPAQSVIM